MLMKLFGLILYMVTRKFLHPSLSMNFVILLSSYLTVVVIFLSSQWCFFICEMMMLNFVISNNANYVDFREFGCWI
jgi:hypothetical protein